MPEPLYLHDRTRNRTPQKFTLQYVVSRYRDRLYATKTSRQAKSNLTNFQPVVLGDLLSLPLDKLTPPTLDSWLGKRLQGASRSTAKRNLNAIKAALNKAVLWT